MRSSSNVWNIVIIVIISIINNNIIISGIIFIYRLYRYVYRLSANNKSIAQTSSVETVLLFQTTVIDLLFTRIDFDDRIGFSYSYIVNDN